MWPGRGCLQGGNAAIQNVANLTGDIPTTTSASGIWSVNDANFYTIQQFQGLNWPSINDPFFANVDFLCHFDEHTPNGNLRMLPPSRNPNDGDAFENLTQSLAGVGRWGTRKFGLYSWMGAGGNVLDHNISNNIVISTLDRCMEGWVYLTSTAGVGSIWDLRSGAGDTTHPLIRTNAGKLSLFKNGVAFVEDTNVMSTNTWHHWAWQRDTVQGKSYMYLDGVSVGTPAADVANYGSINTLRIGNNFSVANPIAGFLDEMRAASALRYPGGTTFTPPNTPFPDY